MNRADSVSCQIPVKDHSDGFSLFGIDDHFLPDLVIAQNVAVSIDNAVFHRGLLSGFDSNRSLAAFILGERRHDRQPQLAVTIKGSDVVIDEKHFNALCFQAAGVL